MLHSLIGASIRFRFAIAAIVAGIVIVAGGQLRHMHADVLPETSAPVVRIQTEAQGLSAPEVEALVTVPLEKNLLEGVRGVTDVTSQSIPGLSAIDLHFAPGTSIYVARQLVQERLTGAFVLPNVSKPPVMLQPVSSTGNVMIVGLTSPKLSPIDLSVLARWTIVPRLLGVAGVADVSTFGQADRQLQVLVDPARLAAHHVGLDQIIETAGNSQLVSPLSFLEASTPGTGGFLEDANQRITIRHVLPFGTPANLAQVPVAGTAGRPLRLGSVTQVVQGHQPLIGDGLVRGRPGLVLVVQKLPSASVLSVTRGLDQALSSLRPSLPGVRIDVSVFRPASYLGEAGRNLRLALLIAAGLAALALILLLAGLRLAVVGLAAIAISLIAATALLYALGYTFNALVVLGLLLALAVVADDAAGAADRLLARRARARDGGRDAAAALPATGLVADALSEFAGPLCTATVAAVLAAAPLLLASGLTARFLRPMALAFAAGLAVSMLVTLLITPALAAVVLAVRWREPRLAGLLCRFDGLYRDLLRRGGLRIPRPVLAALLVIGIGGLALLPAMHPGRPAFADRDLVIRWAGPPGMSLTELDRLTALASHELARLRGVQDVAATLGRAVSSDQIVNPNSAEIWVTLRPDAGYDRAAAQVRAIATGTPGIRGSVSTYEGDAMAGVLSGHSDDVVVRIYGPEYPELARLADRVKTVMSHVRGLGPALAQLPVDQPTLDVRVNLDRATRDGVKPGDIRREVATLVNGLTAGNFFEQEKVFDVVVVGAPAVRASLSSIEDMLVDTVNGGHARLGSLASVRVTAEPAEISHEAMSRYVDVVAPVTRGSAHLAGAAVRSQLARLRFPVQYYFALQGGPGGGTPWPELISYAVAALAGIVLLAHAALGSWRLALLVLAVLPLPVAAGAAAAFAIGARDSLAAAAALLGVLAITIRQALRMIAASRGRAAPTAVPTAEDDADERGAVTETGFADGARPVLGSMTLAAVILLPFVALGNVAGNELPHTAAVVLLTGLVVATLVNLYVLPAAVAILRPAASPDTAGPDVAGPDMAGAETGADAGAAAAPALASPSASQVS
jgi:Cu/Ag efflux pump CusA